MATTRAQSQVPHTVNDESDISEAALSERQRKILSCIRESVAERGYAPSVREIGAVVGLASASSVAYQLNQLQRKGFLRKDPRRPRAVDIRPPHAVDSLRRPPRYVPVLGEIAAGTPILAEERVEEMLPLPSEFVGEGNLFLLKVKGDSMIEAAITDGDWVVVRQQPEAHSGEIVAAMIGDEATVKTFKRRDNKVELLPANPLYDPIPAENAEILGRVVAVMRRI
ncbi:SOS-response transcriptional repressor LexA [Stackebrandtia endophytica]|uniref:LexA repressor n=1 Tax=Stackebrandtia endophytica TaxID=1496996 RepID=A0A543B337_9ACTN|nr:transcriptional repressor LexA [Stackebrandtia endophytica]TQL79180.1 SOS-response transcriptional repressor LexA [Stackebrandtia endophytica]